MAGRIVPILTLKCGFIRFAGWNLPLFQCYSGFHNQSVFCIHFLSFVPPDKESDVAQCFKAASSKQLAVIKPMWKQERVGGGGHLENTS